MRFIATFHEEAGRDASLVGGKGTNLGRLTQAGFDVPPGSTVTTAAYRHFIEANELWPVIARALEGIVANDADSNEAQTAAIRKAIVAAPMPKELQKEIVAAYRALGQQVHVAVRSSGTAEDLEAASFAGQHDTYLDIQGDAAVVDAVKRCWASLWTARAVSYRQTSGFDHATIGIAIVLQKMIESEVSGVMFTANPMTAAVDETVINASYGLGEAIVSGIITPDLFVIDRADLHVRSSVIGTKALRIDRDRTGGPGTVETHVTDADRARACLDDDQLAELAALGARVAAYYEGYPQDIEWAFADGQFYLLQSRDITGVDFSWDEDLDAFQNVPKDDTQVWTRSWSDATWTGRITPLFYSARAENAQWIRQTTRDFWGLPGYGAKRIFKFHKGFVYYGSDTDYLSLSTILHPTFRREDLMENLPPAWREKIRQEPFSWWTIAKMYGRIAMNDPNFLPWNNFKYMYRQFETQQDDASGLPPAKIARLNDDALKIYCDERNKKEGKWVRKVWTTMYLSTPIIMGLFTHMLEVWADEKDPSVKADLLTGCPEPTITEVANHELIDIAQDIAGDTKLRAFYEKSDAEAFFAGLRAEKKWAGTAAKYDKFLARHGHRGHADRDIFFDRRFDNPELDYTSLGSLLDVDHAGTAGKIEKVIARREELTAQVVAKLRMMPFGDLRAQAFVSLQSWLLKFWQFRDDQRAHVDRATYSQKLAYAELGKRLLQRGIIAGKDDYFMFSMRELFAMLDRGRMTRLDLAKLKARRRNYDRYRVEFNPPKYMVGDHYADLEAIDTGDDPNRLKGVGMSRGLTTGIARVIPSLTEIGRVKPGEILVTVATDPGWTPVFAVISGLVLETGGMLAHGACISREYGIPATQVAGAMVRIKDGDRIEINGDLGTVTILTDEEAQPEELTEAA